ncbi:MAG: DoxX family protein [Segetibacter sp.]|nr:DoxX family protein [Segetibacter sp.]
MRLFSWLLLLLIIFFTFLTGYAVLHPEQIKTCGCFGDCLPLTPVQSFLKDLILTALILFIFIQRKIIGPVFSAAVNSILLALTLLFCIVFQWFVLKHLPVVDCLPYKAGNNLVEQMKVPEGAVADSFAINFKYRKNGKDVEFDMNHFPEDFNDSTYQFVERYQKLVRPGSAQAAITDFNLTSLNGTDTTADILNQANAYVLLFMKDAGTAEKDWAKNAAEVEKACQQKGMPFYVVTATVEAARQQLNGSNINFLKSDATVIKTAARVNPTFFIMKQATVLAKYANADFKKAIDKINVTDK